MAGVPFIASQQHVSFWFVIFPSLVFFLLGLTLIILAVKAELDRTFKKFLILTGASAVGIFASMLLHNLVYGAFILWFGEGFWERIGLEEEPFFFMLAIFVCPLAYLVGTVSSIVLMIRRKKHETQPV